MESKRAKEGRHGVKRSEDVRLEVENGVEESRDGLSEY
jgi:hypothetical protein